MALSSDVGELNKSGVYYILDFIKVTALQIFGFLSTTVAPWGSLYFFPDFPKFYITTTCLEAFQHYTCILKNIYLNIAFKFKSFLGSWKMWIQL